ncbi:MAG: hypothetical protein NC122_01425 [Faecalibacterium sp.]|nr:hypothetical protein [Ruminococcus flavefaciens]MCM1392040.1 hypothetical protein [Ruminococcus sp.]MCM1484847.1 hypothetical protein [Faecalibacterium sp.]
MEDKLVPCPICGSETSMDVNYDRDLVFYHCSVCGKYQLGAYWNQRNRFNKNHLSAFLAYNAYEATDVCEHRYYTTVSDEICDELQKEGKGRPVHIDSEIVEAWYPKSFAQKIDMILLYIYKKAPHLGQSVSFPKEQLYSLLFIDRYELINNEYKKRNADDIEQEGVFMLSCLSKQGYIETSNITLCCDETQNIILAPSAYSRIDEIQRNTANGKNVLVAMKFGDDTKALREAIRTGIQKSGYVAVFIDEVQHNDFITPELLKHIKDSKFVVVDLTHQNNGAYFEEGYAMGLGKPVIQLCKQDIQLHFDIAQKNTIMWATEDDIPERLLNRIIATID